jgi:m7GpppX diphosphatase
MEEWHKNIKLLRILNDDHEMKFAAIEGEIEDNDGEKKSVVLLFEKTPFHFDDVAKLMKENELQFKVDFINDIYHKYIVEERSSCNDIKLMFIYPATPLHIKRYSKKEFSLISETRHRYETIVRPYVEKNQLDAQWIYNIIDGKSEQERILLETDQFIVVPGSMWDGKAIESLHILVLVKSHDIHNIRYLKSEHIPILESLLEKTTDLISLKYGVSSTNIRAFFHYPPTFYHLHIHFTTLENRLCGCEVERAHLVQDVIDHLKLQNDYYQTKTLYYKIAIDDPLYKILEENNQQ